MKDSLHVFIGNEVCCVFTTLQILIISVLFGIFNAQHAIADDVDDFAPVYHCDSVCKLNLYDDFHDPFYRLDHASIDSKTRRVVRVAAIGLLVAFFANDDRLRRDEVEKRHKDDTHHSPWSLRLRISESSLSMKVRYRFD